MADDSAHQTVLAYWNSAASVPSSLTPSRERSRRRSWHSGAVNEASGSLVDRTTSPYRTVTGRWTSQWEDQRGLHISNEGSNEEDLPSSASYDFAHRIDDDDRLFAYSPPVTPGRVNVKRKPVPLVADWDELEASSSSADTTPIELGKQQRVVWTALEEPEPLSSKHTSHVSRASATTEALHSHVDQLRAGPSYQVDPSASNFLLASESVPFPVVDTTATTTPTAISPSLIGKRPRAMSLLGKIKERVRKTSGAMLLSSPLKEGHIHSPPLSPPLSETGMSQCNSRQDILQGKTMYSLGRRKSNKRANLAAKEAELFAKAAKEASRHSFASNRSRGSRHSLRSINSARSANRRSRRSFLYSPQDASGQVPKQQQQQQQQWWKGQFPWPRKGSGNIAKMDADASWVDEDEENVPPAMSTTHSPTGSELYAMEEECLASPQSRSPAPIAVITRDNLSPIEHYEQQGISIMQPSSSGSTFSSLTPLQAPALVPPPRKARKTKNVNSGSNGEDSSSAAPSPLPDEVDFTAEAERVSPLSLERRTSNVTFPSPETARRSISYSESGSRDQFYSDASSDHHMTSIRSWEADRSGYSTVHPINDEEVQTVGLSPFRTRMEIMALQEDDEGDDGFTVMDTPLHEIQARDRLSRASDSATSTGMPSVAIPWQSTQSTPRKRPLPAPPVLAQPRTVFSSVARSSSTGSTFAGSSSFGAQTSVASMRGGLEGVLAVTKRRPLPPTPIKEEIIRSRSVSMPSERVSRYAQPLVQEVGAITPSPHQSTKDQSSVRESWKSADGPWQAEVIVLSDKISTTPTVQGKAKASIQVATQVDDARELCSPVQLLDEAQDVESSNEAVEPVPFAETAVQASLAALAALERCEEGNDWQSQRARDKLMGTASKQTRLAFLNSQQTDSIPQKNTSELSDYSNSRSRRRAVPYTRSKGELSSSADERTQRKKSHGRKKRPSISASASQAEKQSNNVAGFTSESDQQATYPRRVKLGPKSSLIEAMTSSKDASWSTRRGIPSLSQAHSIEDWDEKIVPALAKRLQMEAEEEAAAATKMAAFTVPSIAALQDAQSQPKSLKNTKAGGKKQSSSTLSRTPKTRKGYGCEDIKAWQASLGVAAIPVTLVE